MSYKNKYNQYVISASRQLVYTLHQDVILFNLNACFIREGNFSRYLSAVSEALEFGNKLNYDETKPLAMQNLLEDTKIFLVYVYKTHTNKAR